MEHVSGIMRAGKIWVRRGWRAFGMRDSPQPQEPRVFECLPGGFRWFFALGEEWFSSKFSLETECFWAPPRWVLGVLSGIFRGSFWYIWVVGYLEAPVERLSGVSRPGGM